MIRLRLSDTGTTILINPASIATVTEACASSQWHGTKAYVTMQNGKQHGVSETVDEITELLSESDDS